MLLIKHHIPSYGTVFIRKIFHNNMYKYCIGGHKRPFPVTCFTSLKLFLHWTLCIALKSIMAIREILLSQNDKFLHNWGQMLSEIGLFLLRNCFNNAICTGFLARPTYKYNTVVLSRAQLIFGYFLALVSYKYNSSKQSAAYFWLFLSACLI